MSTLSELRALRLRNLRCFSQEQPKHLPQRSGHMSHDTRDMNRHYTLAAVGKSMADMALGHSASLAHFNCLINTCGPSLVAGKHRQGHESHEASNSSERYFVCGRTLPRIR